MITTITSDNIHYLTISFYFLVMRTCKNYFLTFKYTNASMSKPVSSMLQVDSLRTGGETEFQANSQGAVASLPVTRTGMLAAGRSRVDRCV